MRVRDYIMDYFDSHPREELHYGELAVKLRETYPDARQGFRENVVHTEIARCSRWDCEAKSLNLPLPSPLPLLS